MRPYLHSLFRHVRRLGARPPHGTIHVTIARRRPLLLPAVPALLALAGVTLASTPAAGQISRGASIAVLDTSALTAVRRSILRPCAPAAAADVRPGRPARPGRPPRARYSTRIATIGSTPSARRVGTTQASRHTASMNAA
ncbi:MAG TPA: hypothetical protein VFS08_12420 [Gemmatimonadaceae bacterium]|nr:hypothetical protein [Gemmatimonadaceae bacterium]